jgi:hypothetical protein
MVSVVLECIHGPFLLLQTLCVLRRHESTILTSFCRSSVPYATSKNLRDSSSFLLIW